MRSVIISGGVAAILCVAVCLRAADPPKAEVKKPEPRKPQAVHTTVDAARAAGPDIDIQGEYEGTIGADKAGFQVIALGGGAFQMVLLPGGLPGAGWEGKAKYILDGKLEGSKAVFAAPADAGVKKYLEGPPEKFSAVKNPKAAVKNASATIEGGKLTGKWEGDQPMDAKRIARTSPTLGAKAPEGAVVLFDGSGTEAFNGGRLDKETRLLNTDGKDIVTKQTFTNYTLHLEFMLPFRPEARGQGRGNSGCYQLDQYEVQVLDSFGLEGLNNECGGIYTKANPKVNMCLPPLQWQTYDIEMTAARTDGDGKKMANAVITVRHNGVVIHDNFAVDGPTGGARRAPEGTAGPLKLQGHGNPLQYRNIWIVERKK